jgi:hypothetical protein
MTADRRQIVGMGAVLLVHHGERIEQTRYFHWAKSVEGHQPMLAEILAIHHVLDVILGLGAEGTYTQVYCDCSAAVGLINGRRHPRGYASVLKSIRRKLRKLGDTRVSYLERGERPAWHQAAHRLSRQSYAVATTIPPWTWA